MEDIKIGETYSCQAIGLKEAVVGTVEQVYLHTAVVNVLEYQECDYEKVIDLQERVVVKLEDLQPLKISQAV